MTDPTMSTSPLSPQIAAVRRLFDADFSPHLSHHELADVVSVFEFFRVMADRTAAMPQSAEIAVALRHLLNSRDLLCEMISLRGENAGEKNILLSQAISGLVRLARDLDASRPAPSAFFVQAVPNTLTKTCDRVSRWARMQWHMVESSRPAAAHRWGRLDALTPKHTDAAASELLALAHFAEAASTELFLFWRAIDRARFIGSQPPPPGSEGNDSR